MAVPDYQSVMLPLLKILGDGNIHGLREVIDTLGDELNLTDEEKRELLPGGKQAKLNNRVSWARTYMKKAGLLESTGRGKFRITELGIAVLREDPLKIDVKFLERFPAFQEFRGGSHREDDRQHDAEPAQTPEEILEASYQDLRQELAQELLERIMNCSPEFFESLVVDLLVAMGYGGSRRDAGEAVGRTGDEGIDGIIKEDKLGLDVVYIQAKRWQNAIGSPTVREFAGSLMGQNARKGVLITTSKFSRGARDYVCSVPQTKIVLIDGKDLAQLMIDHDIGVSDVATYKVKKVDLDYFGDEYRV